MKHLARSGLVIGWRSAAVLRCTSALFGCASTVPAPVPSVAHEAAPVAAAAGEVPPQGATLEEATVIELASLRTDPARFSWFDFKPGVKKLILSGAPDSRHVAVLWYFEQKPGVVPLHYHEKTESIFVIDGAQSDAKGQYAKGSFYFNPPGSGHDIFDSSGLFLLSYAAPPDFKRVAQIGAYENLVIAPDYSKLALAPCDDGSSCYALPLAASGGMLSRFVRPSEQPVSIATNALLVLEGTCSVAGRAVPADTLVVTKSVEPATYRVARNGADCLLFALAFQ